MKIVCFSGLGADERMFSRLKLSHQLIHIAWIAPHDKESISSYAQRLIKDVPMPTEPFGIMGLSFGGVVAQELAKVLQPALLILISSLEQAQELPWYYRSFKILPEATPMAQARPLAPSGLFHKVFGAHQPATQELLHNTLATANPKFIRWAVYHILRYTNHPPHYAGPCLRLHGRYDKLISCPLNLPEGCCIKGGHLMVYEQAEKVSRLIEDFIKKHL